MADGRHALIEKAIGERFGDIQFFVNPERSIFSTSEYNPRNSETQRAAARKQAVSNLI
jgi:hypothetical protein